MVDEAEPCLLILPEFRLNAQNLTLPAFINAGTLHQCWDQGLLRPLIPLK